MESVRTEPRARKQHSCEVCGWVISPGEKYERVVTFDGGDVLTWKAHLEPCSTATDCARDAEYGEWAEGIITGGDVREWASETTIHDPLGHPEAVEIDRRLQLNDERARAARMDARREA